MRNFFAFIVLVKLLLVLFIANSYAAKGVAEVYKVTMKKAELCTGSTGITDCAGAVVVGEGSVVVDIAAVDAGAAAAAYGTPAVLVLGTTYTHMRVTIDRKFTMKSESGGIDTGSSGDTDKCVTIATTDGMYRNNESSEKYTVKPVFAEDGTWAEFRTYMVSDNYYQCAHAACSAGSADQDQTYGTTYATYQEQHAEGDGTNEHMLVYELAAPYTVAMQPPTIDIGFGTQTALGAYQVDDGGGNNFCSMWAEEPVVTITIK
tara:strand:- start:617 stop:1399 length:783 start_codon:yes stop_codon:yes gene_type:complete